MSDTQRKGDWLQTYSGGMFWPIDPREDEVDIRDIAHALSLQCRFSGHCLFHYSVAQHSLGVLREVVLTDPGSALWALLHDASEAYLVDLPRPIKRYSELGAEYTKIETQLMQIICARFGLPPLMPPSVEKADHLMLRLERRDVMRAGPAVWRTDVGEGKLPSGTICAMRPEEVEEQFLWVFAEEIEFVSRLAAREKRIRNRSSNVDAESQAH